MAKLSSKTKRVYADPTMQNEAVIAYVEHDWGNGKHYCPNRGFRLDIIRTVVTYDDWCVWVSLLANWGYWRDGKYHKRNPTDFKGLLTVFEMKVRENERRKMEGNNGHNQTTSVSTRGAKRVSRRGDGNLSSVPIQPPSEYFRTD